MAWLDHYRGLAWRIAISIPKPCVRTPWTAKRALRLSGIAPGAVGQVVAASLQRQPGVCSRRFVLHSRLLVVQNWYLGLARWITHSIPKPRSAAVWAAELRLHEARHRQSRLDALQRSMATRHKLRSARTALLFALQSPSSNWQLITLQACPNDTRAECADRR